MALGTVDQRVVNAAAAASSARFRVPVLGG